MNLHVFSVLGEELTFIEYGDGCDEDDDEEDDDDDEDDVKTSEKKADEKEVDEMRGIKTLPRTVEIINVRGDELALADWNKEFLYLYTIGR